MRPSEFWEMGEWRSATTVPDTATDWNYNSPGPRRTTTTTPNSPTPPCGRQNNPARGPFEHSRKDNTSFNMMLHTRTTSSHDIIPARVWRGRSPTRPIEKISAGPRQGVFAGCRDGIYEEGQALQPLPP